MSNPIPLFNNHEQKLQHLAATLENANDSVARTNLQLDQLLESATAHQDSLAAARDQQNALRARQSIENLNLVAKTVGVVTGIFMSYCIGYGNGAGGKALSAYVGAGAILGWLTTSFLTLGPRDPYERF